MKDFEERLERLEALARDIKREDIKIEDAIKDFEEGIKLSRGMAKEIDAIEGKIQLLMNDPLEETEDGGKDDDKEDAQQSMEGEGTKDADKAKPSDAALHSRALHKGLAKRRNVLPELSLFTDADAVTGTSGEPAGGTRQ